jgi:hypothetical protein
MCPCAPSPIPSHACLCGGQRFCAVHASLCPCARRVRGVCVDAMAHCGLRPGPVRLRARSCELSGRNRVPARVACVGLHTPRAPAQVKDPVVDATGNTTTVNRLAVEAIAPHLEAILGSIFTTMGGAGYIENEYLMRCVTRVLFFAGPAAMGHAATVLTHTSALLGRVCGNPRDPVFNHYIFETLAVVLKTVCGVKPSAAVVDELEQQVRPVCVRVCVAVAVAVLFALLNCPLGMFLPFHPRACWVTMMPPPLCAFLQA